MQNLRNKLLITLGWFFVILGAIGIVLPILPTTPFLILALGLFAKSSPRFHRMLLNNRYFGAALKDWEQTKTVKRKVKTRATYFVIVSFSASLLVLHGRWGLQLMLVCIAAILLFTIWRLDEGSKEDSEEGKNQSE